MVVEEVDVEEEVVVVVVVVVSAEVVVVVVALAVTSAALASVVAVAIEVVWLGSSSSSDMESASGIANFGRLVSSLREWFLGSEKAAGVDPAIVRTGERSEDVFESGESITLGVRWGLSWRFGEAERGWRCGSVRRFGVLGLC